MTFEEINNQQIITIQQKISTLETEKLIFPNRNPIKIENKISALNAKLKRFERLGITFKKGEK